MHVRRSSIQVKCGVIAAQERGDLHDSNHQITSDDHQITSDEEDATCNYDSRVLSP